MDRNKVGVNLIDRDRRVALRKESVDRNCFCSSGLFGVDTSLSARRAWIEIIKKGRARRPGQSLSARRAWIEMLKHLRSAYYVFASLSARRAWIEIVNNLNMSCNAASLSARRAWIEIILSR